MRVKKVFAFFFVPLLIMPIAINFSFVAATDPSRIYGYVTDNKNNPINNCLVTVFINGMQEGENYTNSDGYYTIDLGLILVKTSITLHFKPQYNFKEKVVGTTIYPGQEKQKDVILEQFFALIIGGGEENRFTTDASGMSQTLTDHYSFTNGNIWLLTWGSVAYRDRQVSNANILWAIGEIASRSTSIDHVLIWITSHGWYDPPSFQTGGTYDYNMTATDFDTALDSITSKVMYILLGQCYSGSFIPYVNSVQNRAIYTSCNATQGGYASFYHSYWPWFTYQALDPGSGSAEKAEEADANSDYCISLYELFNWCNESIIKYCDDYLQPYQYPQKWLGSVIGTDTNDFIGDKSYNP